MLEQDPESFLQLPAIDNIVQYASVASTMVHKDAQSSAMQLLAVLTDVADTDAVRHRHFYQYER